MQIQNTNPSDTGDTRQVHGRRASGSGANVRLVLGLILAGLIVLFTLQNAEVIEVRLLFWTWSMPRAVMIFGVLAIGILLGWILSSWLHHKKSRAAEGR